LRQPRVALKEGDARSVHVGDDVFAATGEDLVGVRFEGDEGQLALAHEFGDEGAVAVAPGDGVTLPRAARFEQGRRLFGKPGFSGGGNAARADSGGRSGRPPEAEDLPFARGGEEAVGAGNQSNDFAVHFGLPDCFEGAVLAS